ncbi:hypothetical protein K8Q93_03030 [Candidatus Parcubacteria bacterium]|nr:hypothetical protein [Candidatus Parcubacteria bacterium]
MVSLRTEEAKNKYNEHRRVSTSEPCPLCGREAIKAFKYWKIILNHFPYDRIAEVHHMLVPMRHVAEDALDEEELEELKAIKTTSAHMDYDWIIEATHKNKSIPEHFHLHLIVGKA